MPRGTAAGPADKLNTTAVSQPAIYVASMAALELLKEQEGDIKADVAAGLSLGEYTALTYAGAMRSAQPTSPITCFPRLKNS